MGTIASFAEELLLKEISDIKKGKKLPPSTNSLVQPVIEAKQLDITDVEVSQELVSKVMNESFGISTPIKVKSTPSNSLSLQINTETKSLQEQVQRMDEVFDTLIAHLQKLKATLHEMTTSGMIGVNFAGPQKDPQKPKTKAKKGKLKLKFK